jgi:mRNA interferase HicA
MFRTAKASFKRWMVVSTKGSHLKMKHTAKSGIIIFPDHGSHEMGKGMEKKIRKEAGLNRSVYL